MTAATLPPAPDVEVVVSRQNVLLPATARDLTHGEIAEFTAAAVR